LVYYNYMQINYKNYKLMYGICIVDLETCIKREGQGRMYVRRYYRIELSSRIQEKKYTVYFRKKNPKI